MIRKQIEIVSCIIVMKAVLAPVPPVAAQVPSHVQPWTSTMEAEAFRVRIGPDASPVPLPPLSDHTPVPDTGASADAAAPGIPASYVWTDRDGLVRRAEEHARRQQVSEHSPGLLSAFEWPRVDTPGTRWLPAPSPDTRRWAFGERNWQTRLDEGPEIRLGSGEIAVPEWNESVRLSGISLNQSFLADSDDVSQWNYSLAFGVIDQSPSDGSGDLVFGPKAGSLDVSYDYSPRFSLQSQTEVAEDLLTSGIVGQYDLGDFGRWRSGIARSNQRLRQGWRYRAMADFDLADDVSLGWMGERYTDGFMDIPRYAAGTAPVAGGRQRWTASWDVGRWGEWSGSFERVHSDQGSQQRRFGLSQEFWYSPNLRIGIHAEREVVADDYDIGLRFSFPLY